MTRNQDQCTLHKRFFFQLSCFYNALSACLCWFWPQWSLSRGNGLKVSPRVSRLQAYLETRQLDNNQPRPSTPSCAASGHFIAQSWHTESIRQTANKEEGNVWVWHDSWLCDVWRVTFWLPQTHCHSAWHRSWHTSSVAGRTWRGQNVAPPLTHTEPPPHLDLGPETASTTRLCGGQHWHVRLRVPQADGGQVHEDKDELPTYRQGERLNIKHHLKWVYLSIKFQWHFAIFRKKDGHTYMRICRNTNDIYCFLFPKINVFNAKNTYYL